MRDGPPAPRSDRAPPFTDRSPQCSRPSRDRRAPTDANRSCASSEASLPHLSSADWSRMDCGPRPPDIPLHTNGSESDVRAQVTRRKVSGGTPSDTGRDRRDGFLALKKTCFKLGISFWRRSNGRHRLPTNPTPARTGQGVRALTALAFAPLTRATPTWLNLPQQCPDPTAHCRLGPAGRRVDSEISMHLPYRAAAVMLSRAVVVVAALGLQGTGALADEWEDCIGTALDKVVAGCSALIEANARNAPDLARAHVRRGWQYRDQRRLDDALADFEVATQIAPRSSEAFEALGALSRQKGDLVRAAASFEHALQIDPNNARAYVGRGNVDAMRHELDPALADFDRAIALRPEYAFAYLSRGIALRQTGNLDRALADFDHAIALDPSMADAFAARGDTFRARGDVDRAIVDYDQVLALTPDNRHARDMRASALAYKAELARAATGPAPATAPASSAQRPPANSASPMQSVAASAVHGEQRSLSQTELAAIRAKIAAHWAPAIVSQPDQYVVVVRFRLERDGRLSAAPEVVSTGSAPHYQAAAEAAKRAIVLSQPFDMLSPSNYDAWKDVEIIFDPRELKALPVIGNSTVAPRCILSDDRVLSDYGGAYDDPRLRAKLAIILSRLSAASARPDVHYSVTILNSPTVNSYMMPNGQLYVTRGLLALANDGAEVASAMAQQMAHVIARHAAVRDGDAMAFAHSTIAPKCLSRAEN